MRLAILPIGAYKPEGFMGAIHLSPSQAAQAHAALRRAVAARPGPAARFWVRGFGEGPDVATLQ